MRYRRTHGSGRSRDIVEKQLLINVLEGEECRIALYENNSLEELYVERYGVEGHVGDIFKGVVTNVEPSIQAAFVDIGRDRNAFLHVSDVIPSAYREGYKKKGRRRHPPIQGVLKRGQHVIVQITRLPDGTRKITNIAEITGIEGDTVLMQQLFEFKQTGFDNQGNVLGRMRATGVIPRFVEADRERGVPVDLNVFKTEKRTPQE